MKLRILAAGQNRSGSTWQYNVLRELSFAAYGSVYGAWIEDYDPRRSEDIHIIKVHKPPMVKDFSYDMSFTCYRDLRDVAASLRRMQWHKLEATAQITTIFDDYVSRLAAWEEKAVRVMRYETMIADRVGEIRMTAEVMGLELPISELMEIDKGFRRSASRETHRSGTTADSDPVSQLHPGHIGDGTLPLENKARRVIEYRFGRWLVERGYKLGWGAKAALVVMPHP